ncbi:DUF5655 domain-containing protein [Asticcacaulis sp. AC402]|uniref:DUF5655 domain-containing protein n=1 Tax=Asticcacaulis sp. AC402 TaxID=1282361 RepID=UPI0003C3C482|nr:DUF5655 domain-containing protein [Asticcacaulis sp. AC402]ESQ74685.1 hypothetical protein ABAC402_13080 [Asticcacaulis sp. AC402]
MADVKAETDKMIANLETATGKPFVEWLTLARSSGLDKHKAVVDWLKVEQGLTHGYANLVAHKTFGSDAGSNADDDLMKAMFAGPKSAMKPVYDRIAAILADLDGVEFAPKKGYVSFRRSKQFGLAQPSTRDRLDLGLVLKGVAPDGRLEAAGSFNAMVSHRVRLASADEVDAHVAAWLRQAWEAA